MKRSTESHKRPQPEPEPKPNRFPITVIAVILLLIIAPLWVLIPQIFLEDQEEKLKDMDEAAWEVHKDLRNFIYYNASEIIVTESTKNSISSDRPPTIDLVLIDNMLTQSFSEHIQNKYNRKRSDITVEVVDYELHVGIEFLNTIDNAKNIYYLDGGELNTYIAGEIVTTNRPVYYKIYGDFTVKLTDRHNHELIKTMNFDKLLYNPEPFFRAKLNEFQNNANTEASDIGRMVRYMLNTVARYRAKTGYGQGPFDSPRNILNEGDIELAVNLAIILEEALLFRAVDDDAVQAIDTNYFELHDLTRAVTDRYNPTGKRLWGEAEISNYIRHVSHLPGNPLDRSLKNLIDTYLTYGVIDPADLMVMYVCLDNDPYPGAIDIDPNDELSILEDEILLNPRYNYGRSYDVSNLKYILNTNLEKPFEFWKSHTTENTKVNISSEKLEVDHHPDYLIAGSEQLSIENIYPPMGWYSNVDLANVEIGNGSGTRCPKQPPPPRPPDHDFRLQWDLAISGNFDLGVRRASEYKVADGTHTNQWHFRTIEFEFPISIFLWFESLPQNNAIVFENLNQGVLDPETAAWIIEPEAIALEYFNENVWKMVRPLVGANSDYAMSVINMVQSYGYEESLIMDCPKDLKSGIIDAMLWRNFILRELIDDKPPWWELITLLDRYIEDQDLTQVDLGEIRLDGFKVQLEILNSNDDLIIYISTGYGVIALQFNDIHNIKTRNLIVNEEISIPGIIDYVATIDLGIDLEDPTGTTGRQSIFAAGVLFDRWEYTIYTSDFDTYFNLVTDLVTPFVFNNFNDEKLSSITLNIPVDFIDLNFTFEILFKRSKITDDFNTALTDLLKDLNSAVVTYTSWNPKDFKGLISNLTTQLEITFRNFNAKYEDLMMGISIGVDRNAFYNAPLNLIFIETARSDDFESLINIINWFSNNCLDIISILGHSSMPYIDFANLITNFEGSPAAHNKIGFLMLVGLEKDNIRSEILKNIADTDGDESLTEKTFFIYTTFNNLRTHITSKSRYYSLIAGYVDQPLISTSEPYPSIILEPDMIQVLPIITITLKTI